MDPDLREELASRLSHFATTVGYQARGHYLAGKSAARWDACLGVTVLVATALTTTGVVSSVAVDGSNELEIATAVLAFTATVVSGAHKAGKYAERASKFKTAGTRFDELRADARELQFTVAQLPAGQVSDCPARLYELDRRRAAASAETPDLKDRF